MGSSALSMYQQQMLPPQPSQQLSYQPTAPYSHPYSPSHTSYANSLISAYGQLPSSGPPAPQYGYDPPVVGVKRASDDVLQAVDLFPKRPRPDSGGTRSYFPQRSGEKLCAFYMTTRNCSYGYGCKFDHPIWVPPGGIPNWKEVTGSASASATNNITNLPQRSGEPSCAYYMKTGECKYGSRCRFNHPKDRTTHSDSIYKDETSGDTQYEPRGAAEGEPTNGNLVAGSNASGALSNLSAALTTSSAAKGSGKAAPLNSKGLPLRLNETECSYYIKTGNCKYGVSCRFHHPEGIRSGSRPLMPSLQSHGIQGTMGLPLPYATDFGMKLSIPPQRPGETDCTFFLKTGSCSYGASCKFHHPLNRQPSNLKAPPKLTMAGLPRREAEIPCAYYMKTGTCKYGSTCKFDHPTPGEVAVKAAAEAIRPDVSLEDVYDISQPHGVLVPYVTRSPAQGVTNAAKDALLGIPSKVKKRKAAKRRAR